MNLMLEHTVVSYGHSQRRCGRATCVARGSAAQERFVITSARSTWHSRRSDVACVARHFAGLDRSRDTSASFTRSHSSTIFGYSYLHFFTETEILFTVGRQSPDVRGPSLTYITSDMNVG